MRRVAVMRRALLPLAFGPRLLPRFQNRSASEQMEVKLPPISKVKVCVALSGGVDSAVTAHLLKQKGFDITAIHMSNWDEQDETGQCSAQEDRKVVQDVCEHLGIDCTFVEFQKEYWNFVFAPAIAEYETGHSTPNPDVKCNTEIKFRRLLHKALSLGDYLATGHYARTLKHPEKGVQLLRGIDPKRDQSYFLCQVPLKSMERVLLPLGSLSKEQVRALAHEAQLPNADRKNSVGLCFIGKRKFQHFLGEYVESYPGYFMDLNGNVVGKHKGLPFYTIGQNAHIGGREEKLFVARKNPLRNEIIVCPDTNHPALYADSLNARNFVWNSGRPPRGLIECKSVSLEGMVRNHQVPVPCAVTLDPNAREPSRLTVRLARPIRAISPGQILALYDGDVCLGGGTIDSVGPSCFDQKIQLPPESYMDDNLLNASV